MYMFLLTSFNVKNTVFGAVAPCSMVEMYKHSAGTHCTCYQGRCTWQVPLKCHLIFDTHYMAQHPEDSVPTWSLP